MKASAVSQVMLGLTLMTACVVPSAHAGVLSNIIETFTQFGSQLSSAGNVTSTSIPGTKLSTADNYGWYGSSYWYGMGYDLGFTADVSAGYDAPMYTSD